MKKRGEGGRLEHTPQYEKETKRLENNIVETTTGVDVINDWPKIRINTTL